MKLAISNIAWQTDRMDEHLALLRDVECDGVELSPSMVWADPTRVSPADVRRFKKHVDGYGLTIPSMHSLTYPRPDLTFFDSAQSRSELIAYVANLGEIANLVEAPVMVFGSSAAREIGLRNPDECHRILVESFGAMATRLEPLGVRLLIEPLDRQFTDCITNLDEGHQLVQAVNHPLFGLHVDLKCSFAEHEDQERVWTKYVTEIKHCHVADPDLRPPSAACDGHREAASAMRRAGYDGYIAIEMRRDSGDTLNVVRDALAFVRQTYLEAE